VLVPEEEASSYQVARRRDELRRTTVPKVVGGEAFSTFLAEHRAS